MKVGKILGRNHPHLISQILRIHLRIGKAAAKRNGVPAQRPNRVGRRIEPVLENARKRTLRLPRRLQSSCCKDRRGRSGPAITMLMPGKTFEVPIRL